MKEILELVFRVSLLTFVIGSMSAMGLSLRVQEILRPLGNLRLVGVSLLANFVLLPLFTLGMIKLMPLPGGVNTGLIILSLAAGAPFLPKLVEISRSDIAFSLALMLLLMVVSIAYLPLVLPLLLPGVAVDSLGIARSLIVMMLIPLVLALLLRARFETLARRLHPVFVKISNIALLLLTLSLLVLRSSSLLSLGGLPLLAIFLLAVAGMGFGYVLGGPAREMRIVLSLGTGFRNILAAFLVASRNFKDPDVMMTMVIMSIVGIFVSLPFAFLAGAKS